MKKLLIAAVMTACLLCSCRAADTTPEKLAESGVMQLEISDNGREYSASLTRDKGVWEYEFTAPESVKGMTVKSENGSYTVTLEKLAFTESCEKLSKTSPMVLITKALDMCVSGKGITAKKQGSKTIDSGVVEGADFTVTFEGDKPISMEIGGEIAVSFK